MGRGSSTLRLAVSAAAWAEDRRRCDSLSPLIAEARCRGVYAPAWAEDRRRCDSLSPLTAEARRRCVCHGLHVKLARADVYCHARAWCCYS